LTAQKKRKRGNNKGNNRGVFTGGGRGWAARSKKGVAIVGGKRGEKGGFCIIKAVKDQYLTKKTAETGRKWHLQGRGVAEKGGGNILSDEDPSSWGKDKQKTVRVEKKNSDGITIKG